MRDDREASGAEGIAAGLQPRRETDAYAGQPPEQTVAELATDAGRGLSAAEARRRLERYGPNEIEAREEPLWHRIFRRFWGPIPWMIEAAALLSALVQKWEDLAIILVMLGVNAGLDFLQEHRALNALKALRSRTARTVLVLRDGVFRRIPARELVPGDVVRLRIGDIVPADCQLLAGDYLLLDQSMLTGESLPVSKKRGEVAYANTVVKQGEMLAVVVNTGAATRFQSVVSLVAEAGLHERSHFQRMVIQIGNYLILFTLGLVTVVVLVSLFRHEPVLEILRFALVLTVAAIPVALPAVLSVTMAVGAMNLARRQAIVSRLVAIEELAGVDVFCSDKTGTLTRNEMRVADPVVLGGHDEETLFLVAALASRVENQDPIELAIFHYIDERLPGLDWKAWRQEAFTPFDPVRKRTEAVVEREGERFTAVKGAPQVLMEMAELDDEQARALAELVDQLAARGYRTLAVGWRRGHGAEERAARPATGCPAQGPDSLVDVPSDAGSAANRRVAEPAVLADGSGVAEPSEGETSRRRGQEPVELIGLIPLFDPPREDSREVIAQMRAYGVQVKMVTGDNAAIAREIGRLLGLEGRLVRARQLTGSGSQEILALAEALAGAIYRKLRGEVSRAEARRFAAEVMAEVAENYDTSVLDREFIHTHESAIVAMIEEADIFAEVVPEDKYRIVEALQRRGHIVGMTGDGVNDAPALRKADCGIAVAGATDAARAAADIILTAPGLGVIHQAVQQARITFERMKSYATFRIAETIRVILFIALSIVVFDFYPITALMIVLLALLNDIPILAIAYDRTRVDRAPVRWDMRRLLTVSTLLGVTGVVSSFLLFFILRERGVAEELVRTVLFLKLIVAGHMTLYITRVEGWFWQRPWPSPILFWATFGTEVAGTVIAAEGWLVAPIGWEAALAVWAYALVWFLINDAVKVVAHRMLHRDAMPQRRARFALADDGTSGMGEA